MASSVGQIKRRRSPSVIHLSPSSKEQGNLNCHMHEARQRSEQCSLQPDRTTQPLSKKAKLNHPHGKARSRTQAAFYDNLSKVWLTKDVLREFDRRNAQSVPISPGGRRSYHQFSRHGLAEVEKIGQLTQSAFGFLCDCTSSCLKDIKKFATHGGPDLLDLRGYSEPIDFLGHTMSLGQSSSRGRGRGQKRAATFDLKTQTTATVPTATTGNTGPYDRAFLQNLIDHGVYPHSYEYLNGQVPAKPNNWEEINQRLLRPRASLSPSRFSDGAFKKFERADAHASKETKVLKTVISVIEGEIRDSDCVAEDIPFTNLDHLTDGTITSGKPDIFYGARPEHLNRGIRNDLNGCIVPSTQEDLPITPNFLLAAKGPDGSSGVARKQACYHGALGARGIQSLQSYKQPEPIYDNNAYTITSIYNDGTLKMYTSHPSQPTGPRNRPEFYMHQINTWGMTGNPDSFRQGATAYRNARDWAEEKRNGFIEAANGRMPDVFTEPECLGSSGCEQASL